MSRLSSRARAVGAALVATAACVAAAPAAHAAVVKSLDYSCEYPLVGAVGLNAEITSDLPSTFAGGTSPASGLSVEATIPNPVGLNLIGGNSLEGELVVTVLVDGPGLDSVPLVARLPFPKTTTTGPGPVSFTGSGELPLFGPFTSGGTATFTVDRVAFNATLRGADGSIKRLPPVNEDSDGDPDTFDAACVLDPASQDATLQEGVVISDPIPMDPPSKPVVSGLTSTGAKVCWVAKPTPDFATYHVYLGTTLVGKTTDTCFTLTGLAPGIAYTVVVGMVNTSGLEVRSAGTAFKYAVPALEEPPTTPGRPVVSEVTPSSAKACWEPSTSDAGAPLSYDVFVDRVRVDQVTGTCAALTGLAPNQEYEVTVRAFDGALASGVSASTKFITLVYEGPTPVKYGYGVSGAAQLKNLTRGSVPLSGSVAAELELATGDFTADLSLQRSTANLVALGFLPVVAKVDVVPTVPVTGNLAGGVLTAATKVRIKLPSVTLFGLQLAGGSSCQTRSASAIALKSVGEFDAIDGGTLAGTFAISDLTGCGALTGLVSPLTAGPGNTIALKLAAPTA